MTIVHVVMGGGIVLGVYKRPDHAFSHARCVTGCSVEAIDLDAMPDSLRAIIAAEALGGLPPAIRRDIEIEEEWNEEHVTPVVDVDDLDDPGREFDE